MTGGCRGRHARGPPARRESPWTEASRGASSSGNRRIFVGRPVSLAFAVELGPIRSGSEVRSSAAYRRTPLRRRLGAPTGAQPPRRRVTNCSDARASVAPVDHRTALPGRRALPAPPWPKASPVRPPCGHDHGSPRAFQGPRHPARTLDPSPVEVAPHARPTGGGWGGERDRRVGIARAGRPVLGPPTAQGPRRVRPGRQAPAHCGAAPTGRVPPMGP